jgi:serine/threonine-protein kinase RsbW
MAETQTGNGRPVLRLAFRGIHESRPLLEIEAWMPSEVKAISPLVDRLMRLIEGSRCITGNEPAVELALQEALSNAVVHGNLMDAQKLVQVRCRCELGKGLSIIVKDQGQGFDPSAVPDPFALEKLKAENGRGIHLMKLAMDEVSFEQGGTEVCMRKGPRK